MLREEILGLVKKFYANNLKQQKYIKGDSIRYAGRVFDEQELVNLVDSSLDFWLTEGRYSKEFTNKLKSFLNIEHIILTNSGSSANLLAISALTSKKLKDRRLLPGNEIITVAAGFPSTVSPIIQNNCIPVFVDVELPTYNINVNMVEECITDKTKAVFLAHTLGNPFNIEKIKDICDRYNLWLIEDNCDALGSVYNDQYTGTFGDISTMSFYPAHHITTGEGGALATNDETIAKIITSFRDWGRDCYCQGGMNNSCGKRFTQQFGTLPAGYDHKYVYSEIGYNLKITDMQSAIGSAQVEKLEYFGKRRRENFLAYQEFFKKYEKFFILPESTKKSDPSWFSYILSVKEESPFTRNDVVKFLNTNKIDTRNIFAGNILRQPAFSDTPHRKGSELPITDFIMNNTFFLGTYPGLTNEMIVQIGDVVEIFLAEYC